jgi:hypothetical protein
MMKLKFSALFILCFFLCTTISAQSNSNLTRLGIQKMKETNRILSQRGGPVHSSQAGQRGGGSNQPEQNCLSATPVCQQTYSQNLSYSGGGTVNELSPNNTCLLTGETNSVWYIFTAQTSGTFIFSINTSNDYGQTWQTSFLSGIPSYANNVNWNLEVYRLSQITILSGIPQLR